MSLCPECGMLAGAHSEGCNFGANIAPRYGRVMNLIEAWRYTGEVQRLRDAHDALSELIAHASPLEPIVPVVQRRDA